MLRQIANELKRHAPFTSLGAVTGIILMAIIVLGNVPPEASKTFFYILHPFHVVLSALVTTVIYKQHSNGKVWAVILIGYVGAIGMATLSDAVIPYLGGVLLNLDIGFHLGFIEKWWLVNPMALLGIAVGYWKPTTRFPHAGHVLLSTWASLFYFTAFGTANWIPLLPFIFLFLFLAVWAPCCMSDIIFPLLFTKEPANKTDFKESNKQS